MGAICPFRDLAPSRPVHTEDFIGQKSELGGSKSLFRENPMITTKTIFRMIPSNTKSKPNLTTASHASY